jgi:phosphohistidine swiveling domain-containing protein
MPKGKEILRGRSAQAGKVLVILRVVPVESLKTVKLEPNEGLVLDAHTVPSDEPYLKQAAALISDVGGPTSHTGITGKINSIPTIVGTKTGSVTLKDGQKVWVEGFAGYETDPTTGKPRPYGAVYEYTEGVPGAKPVAKVGSIDSLMDIAKKKGLLNPTLQQLLESMKKKE